MLCLPVNYFINLSVASVQQFKFLTNMILYKSDSSKGSMTCASGSPNLQLNSKTFGPFFVNIRPAYKTPKTVKII